MRHQFVALLFFGLLLSRVWCHDEHEHVHGDEVNEEVSFVTCGSVLKLKNTKYNTRLHSHEVSYGNSGSGQQSVTGMAESADPNSLWKIEGQFGEDQETCVRGTPIKNNDIIRLRHLTTKKHLHSHLHKSPLTKNQEISCFDKSDSGDNWKVIFEDTTQPFWKRDMVVSFQHQDTLKFLTTSQAKYGNPIPGQHEVCGVSAKSSETKWVAEEGYYFERKGN